ncbi:putative glutamate receptor [Tachypleus tridentatus]
MQAGVWQGAERLPKAHGARITLTSWWMVCLIVLNVYCGNIRAFLSINMPEKPLNTIEEILKTGEGKLLAIPGASVVSLMETSTNEVYREAWRIHAKYNQGPALQFLHYFEEVKKGNYFLGTGSTLRYFSQLCATNISECPFHVSTEPIKLDFMGFGLQKGSPLEYALSERIVWLVQTGFVLRWYQKHTNLFKLQSPCAFANTKSNDNLVPLSLHDLGVTFLILLSGLVVATVTFIFEFLICRSKISSFFRQATLIHST